MHVYLFWLLLVITGMLLGQFVWAADSTVNYKNQPPVSAIAPSPSVGSATDSCLTSRSGAIQSTFIGISGGGTVIDLSCVRRKDARMLASLGLKISATSLMCQDKNVWVAMYHAKTPCPYLGLIGDAAIEKYKEIGRINEDGSINHSWTNATQYNAGGRNYYGQPYK